MSNRLDKPVHQTVRDGRGARAAMGADAADLAQSVIVYAICRGLDLIFASAETHLLLRLQLMRTILRL